MRRARLAGRQIILWGAILMLVWTGYEFFARLDTVWWAIRGVYRLCMNEHVPFSRALTYFDPSMFYLIGFLLAAVVYSLFVIIVRNRPGWNVLVIVLAVGLAILGGQWFGLLDMSITNWMQNLKLVPLALIVIGCVTNIVHSIARRGKSDEAPQARHERHHGHWRDEADELDEGFKPSDMRAQVRARKAQRRRAG